jgi:meso-butanediol dehydrogenase / (S,S)-butanediol dehydrogenase / diacetyl reductase
MSTGGRARFAGKVVVVTGSASGIGREIARQFTGEGARVAIADIDGPAADATAAELGPSSLAVEVDVSVEDAVERLFARVGTELGPPDVLVNNAAIAVGDGLLDMDAATWDRDVSVGLRGAFLCTRAALRTMVERRQGAIVNITSVNALAALGYESYSAAKAGLISLTQSTAVAYGRHGIRANAIAPGSIRSPIWDERLEADPHLFERLVKWYPLGRMGEPEDVARAALFLASDDAAWITGTVLRVDGGLLAGSLPMTEELLAHARDEHA